MRGPLDLPSDYNVVFEIVVEKLQGQKGPGRSSTFRAYHHRLTLLKRQPKTIGFVHTDDSVTIL